MATREWHIQNIGSDIQGVLKLKENAQEKKKKNGRSLQTKLGTLFFPIRCVQRN